MSEKKKEQVEEISINNVGKLDEKLASAINETDSDNKPTEEEIKQAEEEFNLAANTFNTKKWDIGEVKESKELIDYLYHFLNNRFFWQENAWMGVIKFNEELEEAEKFIEEKKGNAHLKLGYQALEFLYFMLKKPGGMGLNEAMSFEAENEKYVKIFDYAADVLKEARDEIKEIQFLQDKMTAMKQGFYLEVEDEENIVTDETYAGKPIEKETEAEKGKDDPDATKKEEIIEPEPEVVIGKASNVTK